MEHTINRIKIIIAAALVLSLIMGLSAVPSFATAPKTEKVKYLGAGKVEVEFRQDVQYKKTKVTVKDSSGNAYSTSIYDRDDDELKFKIKKYKKGETYNFTISGVRKEHTSKYGKVTATVKIPKEQGKNITAKEARNIAFKDAGVTLDDVLDWDVEKDRDDGVVKYEVSFETEKWEYDYEISLKGAILDRSREVNDDYSDYEDDYDDYDDYDDNYDDADTYGGYGNGNGCGYGNGNGCGYGGGWGNGQHQPGCDCGNYCGNCPYAQ